MRTLLIALYGGFGLLGLVGVGEAAGQPCGTPVWFRADLQPVVSGGRALVYDAARRRMMTYNFGSWGQDDWWEWDGAAPGPGVWAVRRQESEPGYREFPGLAFDEHRRTVLLFGGFSADGTPAGDTWEWDGSGIGTWVRRNPPLSPTPRGRAAMAYDPDRQTVLLVSGGDRHLGQGSTVRDSWEWDGDAGTWTIRSVATPLPVGGGPMVYESRRHMAVVVCWNPDVGVLQTWEWDADGNRWSLRAPAVVPNTASSGSLAYDSRRGRSVLVAYASPAVVTWEWDGENWAQRALGSPETPTRPGAIAYDSTRGVVSLVASSGLSDLRTIIWEYDGQGGGTWITRDAGAVTPVSSAYSAAYDESQRCVVLFGGSAPQGNLTGETWIRPSRGENGGTWSHIEPAGRPRPRYEHAMAYDAIRRRTLLFGGISDGNVALSDTWELDLGASPQPTWTMANPGTSPAARLLPALTYDSVRGRVLMFGGQTWNGFVTVALGDTWEWDGSNWILRASAGPPARCGAAMAFDPARNQALLFGGAILTTMYHGTVLGDTWAWDPSAGVWTQLLASGAPSPRYMGAMAYDAHVDTTVLFGGASFSAPIEAQSWGWDWSTRTWRDLDASGSTGMPSGQSMVYDSTRRTLLRAGYGGQVAAPGTWELSFEDLAPALRTPIPRSVYNGADVQIWVDAPQPGPASFRWRRDGARLQEDERVSGPGTPVLRIDPVRMSDSGLYDVEISSECGTIITPAAGLWVQCYANCDGSITPPVLNVADFLCFANRFAAGDPYANCDGSTVVPTLNVSDFLCFLSKFAEGCP